MQWDMFLRMGIHIYNKRWNMLFVVGNSQLQDTMQIVFGTGIRATYNGTCLCELEFTAATDNGTLFCLVGI